MAEKSNISDLFDPFGNLTLQAIERYLSRSLDEEDRALVERHLEGSLFDREAVEGFRQNLSENHHGMLERLNEAIVSRAGYHQRGLDRGFFRKYRWTVAASLVLVMSLASVMYMMGHNQKFNIQFAFVSQEKRNWEPVTVSSPEPSGTERRQGMAAQSAPKPQPVLNRMRIITESPAETGSEMTQQEPDIGVETTGTGAEIALEEEVLVEDQYVFIVVEEMPEFPGGQEALVKFLARNMLYPAPARENGIQGSVYVNFVVNTDGSVSDVRVLKGIGGGCDEEAVRVVSMLPKWKPGKQRGVPTRVQYNLPVRFKLE